MGVARMAEPTFSLPDIAEELMHEFQGVFAVSTVTQVVLRLSHGTGTSVTTLANGARQELLRMSPDADRPPDS